MEYDDPKPPEAKPIQPSGDPYQPPQQAPPQGAPPYGPPPGYVQANPLDGVIMGLGVAGLVVGILALLFSMITCLGMYAIYPAGIAIVLSGIATILAVMKKSSFSVLTVIALVISVAAIGKGFIELKRTKDTLRGGEKILKKGVERLEDEMRKELQRQDNK